MLSTGDLNTLILRWERNPFWNSFDNASRTKTNVGILPGTAVRPSRPSCRYSLFPADKTVPSESKNSECVNEQATWIHVRSLKQSIRCGVGTKLVTDEDPKPSCPWALTPHPSIVSLLLNSLSGQSSRKMMRKEKRKNPRRKRIVFLEKFWKEKNTQWRILHSWHFRVSEEKLRKTGFWFAVFRTFPSFLSWFCNDFVCKTTSFM